MYDDPDNEPLSLRMARGELCVGEIFRLGWRVVRTRFGAILAICLLIYLPLESAMAFIPLDKMIEEHGVGNALRNYYKLIQLTELLFGTLVTMAIIQLAAGEIMEAPKTWTQAFGAGLSRWLAAIGTQVQAGFMLVFLTLLLIVPGVIWCVYFMFNDQAVALRGISGSAALEYSKSLVKGRWWTIFKRSFAVFILPLAIILLTDIPYWLLPDHPILDMVSNLVDDVIWEFYTILMTVYFLNLVAYSEAKVQSTDAVAVADKAAQRLGL